MKRAIIHSELTRLCEEHNGLLRPRDVVAEARQKSSPLHPCFEWNNGKAAEEYRLWQARQLIRVCVTIPEEISPKKLRAFVSLMPDRGGSGYRILADVMSDEARREQLLAQALEELDALREKYKSLRELASVFEEVRKVRRKKAS